MKRIKNKYFSEIKNGDIINTKDHVKFLRKEYPIKYKKGDKVKVKITPKVKIFKTFIATVIGFDSYGDKLRLIVRKCKTYNYQIMPCLAEYCSKIIIKNKK